ncbi:transport and Golgi organization protein 1 homolog [Urocitellus parryii]
MAAAPGLLFWLFMLCPTWRVLGQPDPSTGRRCSKHKLCADNECTVLMYRGEALEDFTSPDFHFVNLKKGDPVYVYYKLAEVSPELWAGSVRRIFGYFPKDFIKVVREYTKEELQIPLDETDYFVCFDGGRDDFDNYNVEELLGFLELYDSANEDSEKAIEKVEQFPEVSQDVEPEPKPVVSNSERIESAFSENTMDLGEQFLAQKNHPRADSQTDNAQCEQTSFELFEEILPDELKVPESESNKTSNISQVSNEQEKTDAYKLLKKEMTLDLKTKFGSTADAFVSDDETTRLGTSIEDDFDDEELDADYYAFDKEEEENEESFGELPLLTFINEEDMKFTVEFGVEKYSIGEEQNSNEEDKVEVTLPPGIKDDDKNILTTLEDTLFIGTGGDEKTDMMDLENSYSEEETEDEEALVPDRKKKKPQAATDYIYPESAESGLFVETSKTDNDEEPKVDIELHIKGKETDVQEMFRFHHKREYQVIEQQISKKMNNFMKENEELMQKLSNYEQKMKESKKQVQETMKKNMILSDEATKYKDKVKLLEKDKELLDEKAKSLLVTLASEREQNAKNQDLIMENKKSIEKLKDVISMNNSELSELQIILTETKLHEAKVKLECRKLQKENTMLKKEKEQLQQEVKDWSTSHAELSEQIKSFEKSQKDLQVALSYKDDTNKALTNYITQLNRLQCESESEDQSTDESDELTNGEISDRNEKIKDQIKQMMDVSRTQTTISVVEEDLKLLQLELRASKSTKCNLEDQIKKLESDCNSLRSSKVGLEEECKTLRQKVEILNELYQQNEVALQKKLSQEEYERLEKEQRLSAADEKVVSSVQEVKNYKRRIEEMEEELQKAERSFKNQIAMHEKKAHDNWLKARSAERAVAEEKREAANLRQNLLEMTQKMAVWQDEPVIVKPMPGRPNLQNPPRRGPLSHNGSFGPSPVSGGECSPPLTAEPAERPPSATLNQKAMPRNGFDPGCGPAHMNSSSRSSSPAKVTNEGEQTVPQEPETPSVSTITSLTEYPVGVHMAMKGPPPFSGVPFMGPLMGRPPPPPIRYGPPLQLGGPFGPRPIPPPFGPGMRPPIGFREYAPCVPPGKWDLPFDPRDFFPGPSPAPFRPLGSFGPREYFIPGAPLPLPTHGPQDYGPPPAAKDLMPSGFKDEPPYTPNSQISEGCSQALKQGP